MFEYYSGLFPKTCPNCGHEFPSLKSWIDITTPLGHVTSYDADAGDWETRQPAGTLAFANCSCGTTLSLTTDNLPVEQRVQLLEWLRGEISRRQCEPDEILDGIRQQVRALAGTK